jgi:hypothetical protein
MQDRSHSSADDANQSPDSEKLASSSPRKLVLASPSGPQHWKLSAILRPNGPVEIPVAVWKLPPHKLPLVDLQRLVNDGFRWIIYCYTFDVYYLNGDQALGIPEEVVGEGFLYGFRDGLIWSIELRTNDLDRSPLEGWEQRGFSFTPEALAAAERHYTAEVFYDRAMSLPVFGASVSAIRSGASEVTVVDGSSLIKMTALLACEP